jgi:hypothetical protein
MYLACACSRRLSCEARRRVCACPYRTPMATRIARAGSEPWKQSSSIPCIVVLLPFLRIAHAECGGTRSRPYRRDSNISLRFTSPSFARTPLVLDGHKGERMVTTSAQVELHEWRRVLRREAELHDEGCVGLAQQQAVVLGGALHVKEALNRVG